MLRWIGTCVALAFAVVLATAAYLLNPSEPRETRHQPVAMRHLGEGGDPLVIMIGIEWSTDGWCSGQLTVTATETPTEVRVADVVNHVPDPRDDCAGLGSDGRMAWADLTLSAPLGTRTAVRATDGHPLPVLQLGS